MNSRHQTYRNLKDKMATLLVRMGGVSVIVFIALIMFYLLYVVVPLFKSAEIEKVADYALPQSNSQSIYLAMDEYADTAVRLVDNGTLIAFQARTGTVINSTPLLNPDDNEKITSIGLSNAKQRIFALGLENGKSRVYKINFDVSYPDDVRQVEAIIEYPLGEDALTIDPTQQSLLKIAVQENEDSATLAAITSDQHLIVNYISKQRSFLDDSVEIELNTVDIVLWQDDIEYILMDQNQIYLYIISKNGRLTQYDISAKSEPSLINDLDVVNNNAQITSVAFLAGDLSLLIGTDDGYVLQWTILKNTENIPTLVKLREFRESSDPIVQIVPEFSRKGFIGANQHGKVGIFHTTAKRLLVYEKITAHEITQAAISPRADAMLIEDKQQQMQLINIHNEHPEISWQSLWGKVWYESYNEPQYIWQSSSASDDFEPKFSLIPISFGTLKAAFYAMLMAIPLSLMGAIYTAHFMAPQMRKSVKPTIEIMEALPTVILGFLAGLWLAPFVETNLPGIFSILIVLPMGLLIVSYLWTQILSKKLSQSYEGWEAAILLPVVVVIIAISIYLSPAMESWFFAGDMRMWLTHELGIGFDQRNAIVVGLAMGFAVIPTIFSIAEDAVFGVPKYLVYGSLALGATPWQTMTRVVLLTASPGIFSAVMIGLGRAVGETMIVLMATGNTPVMDFSPFEGLRTLSANIAVELPESEVNSTHFRVLFLAGLVLFAFTFLVNSIAEIIRQRLRKKYSSL